MDPTVATELEAVFAGRTRAEWAAFDDEHGCCLEPVLDLDEALERAADAVVEVDQPGATAPVRLLGPPVALSRTPPDGTRPAPPLGADTDAVLAGLGYDAGAIAALKAAGAVAGPDSVSAGSFLA
jgi:alpha-methylacyl-CoA racemase